MYIKTTGEINTVKPHRPQNTAGYVAPCKKNPIRVHVTEEMIQIMPKQLELNTGKKKNLKRELLRKIWLIQRPEATGD